MRDPLISVVINNYNYAEYVGQAIESVLGQAGVAVECLVVDDGSTDDSRAVIEAFPGIRRIYQSNGGQLSAVRAGFEHARGDIVIFLDADDCLYPHACRDVASAWTPGLALLQFGLDKVDGAGTPLGTYPNETFLGGDHRAFVLTYGYLPSSPMSGNAFSREYLSDIFSGPAPNDRMAADGYLIFCAPLFGAIDKIDRRLGLYRVHSRNTSPSAGVNAQSLQRQLLNDIAFREGLVHYASRRRLPTKRVLDYLGPYDFRTILLLNRGHGERSGVAHIGTGSAVARAVWKFVTYPGIALANRLKNILAIMALPVLPRAVARRVLPGNLASSTGPGQRARRDRNRAAVPAKPAVLTQARKQ